MKPIRLAIVSTCILACAPAACSRKTAPADVTRTVLERAPLADSNQELRLMFVEFPPGAASPQHRHPVGALCYVIEGTAESQYEGEPLRTLHAGDSYQDLATKKHLVFKNASSTDELRLTCTAKIGANQPFFQPLRASFGAIRSIGE